MMACWIWWRLGIYTSNIGGDAHRFNQQIASIELKQMNGLQGIAHAKMLGFEWRLVCRDSSLCLPMTSFAKTAP
jgi:hypothetical protein